MRAIRHAWFLRLSFVTGWRSSRLHGSISLKRFEVVFAEAASEQLLGLYRRIAAEASVEIARRYTDTLIALCEGLDLMPFRGRAREDIAPGLRVLAFRRSSLIAYAVVQDCVVILGVFHGGQNIADWEVSQLGP